MSGRRLSLDTSLTPERLAVIKAGGPTVRDNVHATMREAGLGGTPGEVKYRPVALHGNPHQVGPRWPFAVMRIKRILEGAARSSNLEHAVKGAEHARLAQEYVETWAYYMTRTKPPPRKGSDHNPFRRLSDYDAFRKFVRCVEDICDRSRMKLGPWYVK